MFLAARKGRDEVLATIGDAIASFLHRPDPYTERQCLLSRENVSEWSRPLLLARLARRQYTSSNTTHLIPRTLPRRKRWWQAVTISDWCIVFVVYDYFFLRRYKLR